MIKPVEDVSKMKVYFLEMLKQGEKISRIYSGKEIDEEMLKYAIISARNFVELEGKS